MTDVQETIAEPSGPMIPVFCIINIPEETINQLLTRDAYRRLPDSYRLFIVRDTPSEALKSIENKSSQAPFPAFETPFLGMQIPELCEIYRAHFQQLEGFVGCVFFVLDRLSALGETLYIVESPYRKNPDISDEDALSDDSNQEGIDTLRADFWIARQIATRVELGQESLLENRDWKKVYTMDEVPFEY